MNAAQQQPDTEELLDRAGDRRPDGPAAIAGAASGPAAADGRAAHRPPHGGPRRSLGRGPGGAGRRRAGAVGLPAGPPAAVLPVAPPVRLGAAAPAPSPALAGAAAERAPRAAPDLRRRRRIGGGPGRAAGELGLEPQRPAAGGRAAGSGAGRARGARAATTARSWSCATWSSSRPRRSPPCWASARRRSRRGIAGPWSGSGAGWMSSPSGQSNRRDRITVG